VHGPDGGWFPRLVDYFDASARDGEGGECAASGLGSEASETAGAELRGFGRKYTRVGRSVAKA
jgi:hypothetical protein